MLPHRPPSLSQGLPSPIPKPPGLLSCTPVHLLPSFLLSQPLASVYFSPYYPSYTFSHPFGAPSVNPADDNTVPIPPTFDPESIHPLALAALRAPKDQTSGLLPPNYRPLPPDHPEVAGGIAQLDELFAPMLTPTEIAFHKEAAMAPARAAIQSSPPRNFLQAHMIIIDQLLMDPAISTTSLATVTGYSRNWLHRVMSSDAFQAKLAERQAAIIDPIIANSIKDRIQGLASRSLEIIEERMENDDISLANALEVFGVASKAMGLGQQKAAPVVAQQFIVHVPPRMASATDWAALHSGRPAEIVVDPLTIDPASLAERLTPDETSTIHTLMSPPSPGEAA